MAVWKEVLTSASAAGSFPTLNQSTNGTAAIATAITVADESTDETCFPLFSTDATGNLGPKSGDNLTFNSATGLLTATGVTATGTVTGVTVHGSTAVQTAAIQYTDGDSALTIADGGGLTTSGTLATGGAITTTSLNATGTITSGGTLKLSNNTIANSEGTTTITLDTDEGVTIAGDLVVSGSTTTINTTTLEVEDESITLANIADTSTAAQHASAAEGAGINVEIMSASGIMGITGITAGSGYALDETFTKDASNGTGFAGKISSINGSGGITGITITNHGTGYTAGVSVASSDFTTTNGTSGALQAAKCDGTQNPEIFWKTGQGGGLDGTGSANGLTGWMVRPRRQTNGAFFPVAVMTFGTGDEDGVGGSAGNAAGTGSFYLDTDSTKLWIRTS